MNARVPPRIKKMSPQLLVEDIERSIEYYTEKIGFEINFRYDQFYAGLIKDGFSIHLKKGRDLVGLRQIKKNNEDVDIIFSVEEIEQFYQELRSRSVEIVQPLREMPYGREFYVEDPDGHLIAFLQET